MSKIKIKIRRILDLLETRVLKIMGIRNWHAVAKYRQEWRKIVLESKVHNGL
jgi:hypothetical protein